MHLEIIGRSRYGKSTFLEHQILNAPGGFVFLDPHGHSAERIADTIPCIYWDASETGIGFNPLNVSKGQEHLIAAQIVYAIKAVTGKTSWGPRLNWILYNAVRLAIDNNGTLLDIPTILTDRTFRTRFLRRASYRPFWEEEFEAWDDRFRNDAIAPVLNKLGMFKANPVLAGILSHNTINFSKVMQKGQRVVVNLAKGKLGDEPSYLLGALIVSSLYSAAQMSPVGSPQFDLFADEFQNFATQSFADILSESGKYGLNLTLCHQYLDQLSEELVPAVFANVSQIVAFNVSAEDAVFLGKEMDLAPSALCDLVKYRAWVKIGLSKWLMTTSPPVSPQGRLEANKRHTRANYSR
jgi:hypothetical protein